MVELDWIAADREAPARRGDPRAAGRRHGLVPGRRRGDLRAARARHHLQEQDFRRALARGRAGVPPRGRQDERDDALRARRDDRGARRPPRCGCASCRTRPGGFPGSSRSRSTPRTRRSPTCRPRPASRPARHRRLAADARQRSAHQGLLDPDRHEARPGGAASSARTTSSARVVDETITHAAGATTASGMTRSDFERIIRESGREPFERDSEYRRVVRPEASRPGSRGSRYRGSGLSSELDSPRPGKVTNSDLTPIYRWDDPQSSTARE